MYHWRNLGMQLAAGLIVALVSGGAAIAAQTDDAAKPSETAEKPQVEKKKLLAGPRIAKDDLRRSGRTFSPHRRKGQQQAGFMAMLDQLKLTDKQKIDLRVTLVQHRKAHGDFRKTAGSEMKQLRAKMEAARKANNFDQMRQLRAKRHQILAKGPNRDALKKQLATILTPEQFKQFEAKMKAHRQKMGQDQKHRRGKNADTMNSDQRLRRRQRPQDRTRPKQEPPDKGAEDDKLDL